MKSNIIEGLQIVGFYSHSQLADRGVKEGDWIVEYNGEKITSKAQLQRMKLKFQNSKNIILKVRRDDSEEYFQIWPGDLGVYLAERERNPEILSDAKRIENIGRLEKRTGMENTFFGSLINILKIFGIEIELTALMGLSAFPFRIQFYNKFSLDALDPANGFDCIKFLFENLKWSYRKIHTNNQNQIKKIIKNSIDNGIPAFAKNLYGQNDWGIITGYQNDGKKLFCRSYNDKTVDYSIAPQTPETIIVFEESPILAKDENNFRPPAQSYINSLKAAKEMLSIESFDGYSIGNYALQKWQNALKDNRYFESLTDKEFRKICINNQFLFNQYCFNCKIAANFLESIIEIFPDSKEHLKRLSKFYGAEGKVLHNCQKYIPINSDEDLRIFFTEQYRNNEVVALIKVQKKNNEILAIMEKLPLFK